MRRPAPRTILLAGWLVFLLYAYPGYLTTEAADELVDSRVGLITDWHSPMLTELWRLVGVFIAGPAGMLILQSGLLLFGSFAIARRFVTDRAAAVIASCLLVVPPVMATTAVICPEAMLAGSLLVAIAMLAGGRPSAQVGAGALLVIACALRPGASLAALPLVVGLLRWPERPRWQQVVLAVAAWAAIALAATGVDRLLVDGRTERNEVQLAMGDVVGTLRYAGPVDDARVRELLAGVPLASEPQIQERARRVYGKELFYAATEQRVFDPVESETQREALYAGRRALIRALPTAYLTHRWRQLYRAIGFAPSWAPVYTKFVQTLPRDAQVLEHDARHSALQKLLVRPVTALAHTFLFRPYVYAILALALLVTALVRRHRTCVLLAASGLVYELSLLLTVNRAEYRDSHWLIVSTLLAGVLLLVPWLAPRFQHARPGQLGDARELEHGE